MIFFAAKTPSDFQLAREMFLEYSSTLDFSLCFQNFDDELRDIESMYGGNEGGIILLRENPESEIIGCVAVRRLEGERAELKRMYIRNSSRGNGYGRQLLEKAIDLAKELGYKSIMLDTMPSMKEAIALYIKYGFKETTAYRFNPDSGAVYLRYDL